MRFVVSADQTIKLESKENVNKIEIVTPKGRIIEFANDPPMTHKLKIEKWYGSSTQTICVQMKVRCNEFLIYTLDKRSDKDFVPIDQLNIYPLWRSVKWQIFDKTTIFVFNFVRQAIVEYQLTDEQN